MPPVLEASKSLKMTGPALAFLNGEPGWHCHGTGSGKGGWPIIRNGFARTDARFPPVVNPGRDLALPPVSSYHDVEKLLAERGFDVSYETVRRWLLV